ncbi:MAG: acyl-CoA dehydrogenase family protein [Pseudomonadota bacterium]
MTIRIENQFIMNTSAHRGGDFLIRPCEGAHTFTPESFSGEERKAANVANAFLHDDVLPNSENIEEMKDGVLRSLLKHAADAGLVNAYIPESYGGKGLSQVACALIAENISLQGSFVVSQVSHTGIAMLPLVCYGKEAQKDRYLSKVASGEMILAYSLTEPEAGTDVRAIRTKAVLSNDGKHYTLNGEKAFCTNGGIADLFTVFAKIEGQKGLSAFLIERNTPGFNIGEEDQKMGILGSSTTPIILNNVKVPRSNVLGEEGRAHYIAYNVLNAGRLRLAASCVGQMKHLIRECTERAKARVQFAKPIAEFELIRHKIARMAMRTYVTESLVYRAARCIDAALTSGTMDLASALSEFSIEAAIAKVYGSEALFFSSDEAVQLFGGYGFMRKYSVEQRYRDCRINRIFEGTNEILRLFIAAELIKRAMKMRLPLLKRFEEISAGLKGGFSSESITDQAEALKRLAIYVAGTAAQKFGEHLKERQSVMAAIADLTMESYAFDSAVARAISASKEVDHFKEICQAYAADRLPYIVLKARKALANIGLGDDKALSKIIEIPICNTDSMLNSVASHVLRCE